MTAKELKASILQHALQGKLVPQDPSDEPASILLTKIAKEKQKLFKEGKIKKQKKLPAIAEKEIPFKIPESWEWVRIGTVFNLQAGKTKTSSQIHSEKSDINKYPCYGGNGLRGYVDDYNRDGDFALIGRQGALCGNINFAHGKFYATEHAVVVEYFSETNVSWSGLFLEALNLNQYAMATAQPGLAVSNIKNVLIPVPPVKEQKRIVAKIEELMPLVNQYAAASEKLNKLNTSFPDQLKKSILQQAVQGKLVPQDPSDEPASVLLKKIAAEKQKLIQEGKIKKQKKLPAITEDEIPFEIPESWKWVRMSDVTTKITDGSHNPPPKRNSGYRVISAKNIKNEKIEFQDGDRYADQAGFEKENPRTNITKGDIILGIIGGSIGNTAIYNHEEHVIAQRSIAIIDSLISNEYLKRVLESQTIQNFFRAKASGTAQGGVYLGELEKLLIPVPPLNEQCKIVEKITEIQELINNLATQY